MQGISDLVMLPGLINLDFADVRTIMFDAGDALLGIGMGYGEHRATLAAEKAVSSPLLETSIEGARSMLLSITGGPDLSLVEASEAAKVVRQAAHPEANIIFGANVDEDLSEQVWVTVVATRFDTPSPTVTAATGAPSRASCAPPTGTRRCGRSATSDPSADWRVDAARPPRQRRRALRRRQWRCRDVDRRPDRAALDRRTASSTCPSSSPTRAFGRS